jgi:hypothetical protein
LLQNLTKQLINKPGDLVWWAELQRSCPSLGEGVIMQLGVDMSMEPNAHDGERSHSSRLLSVQWLAAAERVRQGGM